MNIKIGLLLPRSVIYPSMSFDIVNGLNLGSKREGEPDFVTENIGVAADDKRIYAACEKMLMSGVNVIAGYVNPISAENLQPLFAAANAIFIALDAGFHFPSTAEKLHNVFTLSLQGTLGCSLLARQAIDSGMRTFAYASSYYDAGYRGAMGFMNPLQNDSGAITYNHITKLSRKEFTLEPLAQHLQQSDTDAILAAFCGDMAYDFYKGVSENDIFNGAAVYVSPFMGEEEWLDQTPYPGTDMITCVPWGRKLDNKENMDFTGQYRSLYNREANIFSVLGWEAGHMADIISTADTIAHGIKKFENYHFSSPRGHITLDAERHFGYAPLYSGKVVKNETTGNCILEVGSPSPYTEEERERLMQHIDNFKGGYTSWYNAYGCLES